MQPTHYSPYRLIIPALAILVIAALLLALALKSQRDNPQGTVSAQAQPILEQLSREARQRFLAAIARGDLADDATTLTRAVNLENNLSSQGHAFGTIVEIGPRHIALEDIFTGESSRVDIIEPVFPTRGNATIELYDLRLGEVVEVLARESPGTLITSYARPMRGIP